MKTDDSNRVKVLIKNTKIKAQDISQVIPWPRQGYNSDQYEG